MNSPNLGLTQLDPAQEQLIRQVVASILTPTQKGECRCHWLDCSKTPVLLWKHGNTFTLKIATQKLIGFARSDKHGTEYWRFRNDEERSNSESVKQEKCTKCNQASVKQMEQTSPAPEPETKFPVKEKEEGTEKVQLELGNKGESDQVSETIQKFQAKYGTSSEPKQESSQSSN